MKKIKLSYQQQRLLGRAREAGEPIEVRGAELRTARSLVRKGLGIEGTHGTPYHGEWWHTFKAT